MQRLFLILVLCIVYRQDGSAQLPDHNVTSQGMVGFTVGLSTIKSNETLYPQAAKEGAYFGIGVDFSYYNFEPFTLRYHLKMKWAHDLFHKAGELFEGTGTDPRIDFTGFTWHKVGLNLFATDNVCVGLGGSFADYIIDIPLYANSNGDYFEGITWQEPSGWHWTAGPCLFADAGFGGFALSFIASYDISYLQPKVTDDYESLTAKIPGYKKPHFLFWDLTLNHESGFFAGFDRVSLIDNGVNSNKMSRAEFHLGYRTSI